MECSLLIIAAGGMKVAIFGLQLDPQRNVSFDLALGALHGDQVPAQVHFHALRQNNRFLSYSRHCFNPLFASPSPGYSPAISTALLLINLAENLAANAFLARLPARHHAL